jgi:hypothetical protein
LIQVAVFMCAAAAFGVLFGAVLSTLPVAAAAAVTVRVAVPLPAATAGVAVALPDRCPLALRTSGH